MVSYRGPSGSAGRRKGGWSARLRPAWQSPHWGRWPRPRHCTGHWSCTKWERHLAGAGEEGEKKKSTWDKTPFIAAVPWKHQGEPTSLPMNNALGKVPTGPVRMESGGLEHQSRDHAVSQTSWATHINSLLVCMHPGLALESSLISTSVITPARSAEKSTY